MSRPLGYTGAPMEGGDSYRPSTGHREPYPKPHQQPYPQPRQQQSASSYQPPSRQQHQTNNVAYGPNPSQTSEEAFVNLSSTLLQKHAAYNYPPNYILYNHLSDAERHHFAQAYHSYLNREEVTTYAEVGERPIVQTLREVRQVFGPTLDGMAGSSGVGGRSAAQTTKRASTLQHLANQQNYGPEQQQQQQQQQQATYNGSEYNSAHYHHDMRDDDNTGSDNRSVYTSASRRSYHQSSTNKSRHEQQQQDTVQHQQSVYFEHDYQRQQQRHGESGVGGQQRGGRWTVPAASRKTSTTGPSTTGQYVNMNRQYDHAKPSYGSGSSVQKETELTTRSRLAPGKKVEGGSIGNTGSMNLRQTMSLEESEAIRTKSQARQRLMEEMNHAQELLNRATNLKDRMLYQSHMDRLKKELEDLTGGNDTGTAGTSSRRGSLSQYQPPISPSASLDDCASITSAGKKALGQYVNVVAPGNLPENYQFEAKMGKDTFTATVPTGGVTKGQMFTSRVGGGILKGSNAAKENDVATVVFEDDDDDVATIATYEKPLRKAYSKMDIPRGRWKDGLMDGLFEGLLHPLFWHSWFCPQIALAQIMARLRIVGPHKAKGFLLKSKLDLTTTLLLTILFYFVNLMVAYVLFGRSYVLGKAPSTTLLLSFGLPVLLIDAAVVCLFYFLLIKTRKIVRENYGIPEGKQCPGNEDALASIFCTSCTVSQMGRHTADYTTYRGHCCTQTGLPDHVACDV